MKAQVVQVSAGVGPSEARRFVAKLSERIEALCAACGLVVREIVVHGGEAEPTSVEIVVLGDAEGALAGDLGTHALVARSPGRGRASRKRWFAGVAVHALDGPGARGSIDPRDLTIEATRSRGPGGQHVNKTATAVRVIHRPSGLVVRASDERSQRANLKRAVERIAARLAEDTSARVALGGRARRLSHYRLERGSPVRTYRLGPRGELERVDGC